MELDSNIQCKAPVLFLVFNRPDTTARVFESIRRARPSRLYVAADGPRTDRPGEDELCRKTRAITEAVDWPCEVHTLFRDRNIGCRRAVSSAISWFFEAEKEGIILEDDCLPDQSFFPFCASMLDRYRDTPRVRMVTGTNMTLGRYVDNRGYYFSRFFSIWGWATWRRAWKDYDISMGAWPEFKRTGGLDKVLGNKRMARYMTMMFDRTYERELGTWDCQWLLSSYLHDGLCLTPKVNLISNIGVTGTHMSSKKNVFLEMPTALIDVDGLAHPREVEADRKMDGIVFDLYLKQYTYPPVLLPFLSRANTVLNSINPERWKQREFN